MSAGAQHAAQRLERLLGAETGGVVAQQLGQTDDRIERRPQLVAHIGEEARLRAARLHCLVASDFEVPDHLGKLGLALFNRRDVGPGCDRPTLLRAVLTDPQPSPVGELQFVSRRRVAMQGQPLLEPRFGVADRGVVVGAMDQRLNHILEPHAGDKKIR